jgi:hypothetical protein
MNRIYNRMKFIEAIRKLSLLGRASRLCLCLFFLLILVNCAAKTAIVQKPDESEILRSRATEYWGYYLNMNMKNLENAYRMEAPAYREQVSIIAYANQFKMIRHLDANVLKAEVEGKKGKTEVTYSYRIGLPRIDKKLTNTEIENWVKVEGIWYHIPKAFQMPE